MAINTNSSQMFTWDITYKNRYQQGTPDFRMVKNKGKILQGKKKIHT